MRWLNYVWKAFNARPFGMPVPPLWFAVIVSGLLGAFINPALALIGAGMTALCTGVVASSGRFRNTVDAAELPPAEDDETLLLKRLDSASRDRQSKLEQQCAALQQVLESANAGQEHIAGVWQLAGLHLRLLVARAAALAVTVSQEGEAGRHLSEQADDVKKRLSVKDLDNDLREALDDQSKILDQRLVMQREAKRRLQILDAELERIREQIALIREQALLTSDPTAISRSVDSLAAFLNESGRWMQDQEKLFGDIGGLTTDPFGTAGPESAQHWQRSRKRMGESQ